MDLAVLAAAEGQAAAGTAEADTPAVGIAEADTADPAAAAADWAARDSHPGPE